MEKEIITKELSASCGICGGSGKVNGVTCNVCLGKGIYIELYHYFICGKIAFDSDTMG